MQYSSLLKKALPNLAANVTPDFVATEISSITGRNGLFATNAASQGSEERGRLVAPSLPLS